MKTIVLAVVVALLMFSTAHAQGNTGVARLRSFDEVPALSTPGGGFFQANINDSGTEIQYLLQYSHLQGNVQQSHIHFAQRSVNGGITVFLCSNLGNGPVGTQNCPASGLFPTTIEGTITASNVIGGASSQGIAPGELSELLAAMRAGITYVNVHTDLFPGGEIRGQIEFNAVDRR